MPPYQAEIIISYIPIVKFDVPLDLVSVQLEFSTM